jgi:restriction endonuclease S subunit
MTKTPTIPLNSLFEVAYGTQFDLNKMSISHKGVNFVGRTARNNGVVAKVQKYQGVDPIEPLKITVALGGAILSSFVQTSPFYTAQNIAVLKPKKHMTINELLFYCLAIKHNAFRYGAFGREANRTLKSLEVPIPGSVPRWVKSTKLPDLSKTKEPLINRSVPLDATDWQPFKLSSLFEIKKGKRLTKANMSRGKFPFIGSSDSHNGMTALVSSAIHEGNTITVCYNGSVAEAFYQPRSFWASDDVNVLYPRGFQLNKYIGLFLASVIKQEKYRYNYGRKWHTERMKESVIKLPVKHSTPDWEWMESFIKSMHYSKAV